MNPKRTVVMASGRGSNFRAVLDGVKNGQIRNCEPVALIVDRPGTTAESFARERGLETLVLDYKSFPNRDTYDRLLAEALARYAPELILTLGYMRLLSAELVRRYAGRVVNIHPSLLPAFPGIHAQEQAWKYGVKIAGVTVHFVDEGVDTGPIIAQSSIDVPENISLEGFTEKLLMLEHRVITQAVDLFCRDKLILEGRRVRQIS